MSSVEAPIAPARTPLAPRVVELVSGDWRYVPILTAIVLIWMSCSGSGPQVPFAKEPVEPKSPERRHGNSGARSRACSGSFVRSICRWPRSRGGDSQSGLRPMADGEGDRQRLRARCRAQIGLLERNGRRGGRRYVGYVRERGARPRRSEPKRERDLTIFGQRSSALRGACTSVRLSTPHSSKSPAQASPTTWRAGASAASRAVPVPRGRRVRRRPSSTASRPRSPRRTG